MATTSSVSEDEKTYGRSEVEPESQFAVFLRYPILFESAAQDSDTNGIGALSDTISCNVVRTRNQFPTLQLTYKRGGIHSKELQNGRIIMADMGPDFVHQKFRINQVQKTMAFAISGNFLSHNCVHFIEGCKETVVIGTCRGNFLVTSHSVCKNSKGIVG